MNDANFYCKPAQGERIETKLELAPDISAAIHGVVSDTEGAAIGGALVLLFRVDEQTDKAHTLIAQIVTDAEGHFAFGGLDGDVLYRVKVFRRCGTGRVLDV
ncbi:MAG: carboxypeptidase-like regulatory domain-containing protein [Oscillospiraceae bacterium]|nr:carboxypeptidase-like regulatory domain-containing protein [Oscillospiraceae bacterium]